jgi:hypothetical protein
MVRRTHHNRGAIWRTTFLNLRPGSASCWKPRLAAGHGRVLHRRRRVPGHHRDPRFDRLVRVRLRDVFERFQDRHAGRAGRADRAVRLRQRGGGGAMAEGAVANSNADVAMSTTGIAGPTGAVPGKPVGTVCFGWSKGGTTYTERLVFQGDRRSVREQTVAHALTGCCASSSKEDAGLRTTRRPGGRQPAAGRFRIRRPHSLAAASSSGAGITMYAAGDIARCAYSDPAYSGAADTARTVAAGLAADRDAMVLTLGDHTYPHGRAKEFTDCYGPTWGRSRTAPGRRPATTSTTRRRPRPTSRIWRARRARLLQPGHAKAGTSFRSTATWRRRPTRPAGMAARRPGRHPARCTLAFWHHPLYSSGGHGSIPKMRDAWRLLQDAGAELVLSGHDHDYERFAPQDADNHLDRARGMRQFVVGTGGAYPTPFLLTVRQQRDARQRPHRRAAPAPAGRPLRMGIPGVRPPHAAGPARAGQRQRCTPATELTPSTESA